MTIVLNVEASYSQDNRPRACKPKFLILIDFRKPFMHDNIDSCIFAKHKL